MGKKRGAIGKYNKISLKQKLQLLTMTQFGKTNLKNASEQLEIKFSTAKTICFQYQNNKNQQRRNFLLNKNKFLPSKLQNSSGFNAASFRSIKQLPSKSKKIQIMCNTENTSIDSSQKKYIKMYSMTHLGENNQILSSESQNNSKQEKICKPYNDFPKNNMKQFVYSRFQEDFGCDEGSESDERFKYSSEEGSKINNKSQIQNYPNFMNQNQAICYFSMVQYPFGLLIN